MNNFCSNVLAQVVGTIIATGLMWILAKFFPAFYEPFLKIFRRKYNGLQIDCGDSREDGYHRPDNSDDYK